MSGSVASSSYPQAAGHPSRRDNFSGSSTRSRGSERDGGGRSGSSSHPQVESAVTKLLVSIKQLLESLTLWSTLKMTETEVSDVYVRLGNDFNSAVSAFQSYNIEMSELMDVPNDLRIMLEQCLSEEATPSNLEIYLPTVRKTITDLLQGLREKQSLYRSIVTDKRHRSGVSEAEGRSVRSSRAGSMGSRASQMSRQASANDADSQQQRRISRRRDPTPTSQLPPPPTQNEEGYFPGGFTADNGVSAGERTPGQRREQPRSLTASGRPSRDYQHLQRVRSTPNSPASSDDPNDTTITASSPPPERPTTPSAKSVTPVPSNVMRYSLSDNPVPSVLVDGETPPSSNDSIAAAAQDLRHSSTSSSNPTSTPPETPQTDPEQQPFIDSSLAALKKSDALERRASKRFSTYNISKMTGMGLRERMGMGKHANRRSMAADSTNLTPGDLTVLTEEDESSKINSDTRSNARDIARMRTPTPIDEEVPPVPALPSSASSSNLSAPPLVSWGSSASIERRKDVPAGSAGSKYPEAESSALLTVFLQLGREVKKVSIEKGIAFSSLKLLFVDKFSYSPGQGNFPDIYIRDPSSGVMYELEDVDEVKDKCLLSLNIDPLDQIKQHIDQQMSSLTQELKELRSTVGTSKRMSHMQSQGPTIVTQPFAEPDTSISRPSDRQFANVARRLSRLVVNRGDHASPPLGNIFPNGVASQITGATLQSQWTGGSVLSEASGRIVTDLKNQFDEVQNLRRDLGVMRQLYVDFVSQTKESLSTLRTQAQSVRQLSNSKVGGAREYIHAGKASLDGRTQTALTKIEELQDTVENLKDDVLKRHVSPRSFVVKNVSKDISDITKELNSLKEYIATVKPMWKTTWEEELQNIVEEQQFLTHQEEFLQDLLEDQKALMEVFGHVEKIITLRGSGAGRTRGFRPPAPEEGHSGLSTVMMEIRGAAVDPEKRMKAIMASQKTREREKANRSDEFEAELSSFVSNKKLKMTGGAEEIERVRQKRNDLALKAMFNSSQGVGSGSQSAAVTPTSATFSDSLNSPPESA